MDREILEDVPENLRHYVLHYLRENPDGPTTREAISHAIYIGRMREKAIDQLRFAQTLKDREQAHSFADEVMCQFLRALGQEEVVTEWRKVERWYA